MKTINLILFVCLIGFISCEKTVDSETNRWARNQARLERLMSEYPNFKSALQGQLQEARSTYQEAIQQTDEATKIEWLSNANKVASPAYVSQLDNLDKKIEKLRESGIKLFEYSENNKGILIAGLKSINIESTINDSKSYLASVTVNDKHQAQQVVTKAMSKLDRLQKSISDSIKDFERQLREQNQEELQ